MWRTEAGDQPRLVLQNERRVAAIDAPSPLTSAFCEQPTVATRPALCCKTIAASMLLTRPSQFASPGALECGRCTAQQQRQTGRSGGQSGEESAGMRKGAGISLILPPAPPKLDKFRAGAILGCRRFASGELPSGHR
jgi:hypothetical protein